MIKTAMMMGVLALACSASMAAPIVVAPSKSLGYITGTSSAQLPVVTEGAACTASVANAGVSADMKTLLICQSGRWAKPSTTPPLVTAGASCTESGAVGRDSTGVLLSCQSGQWKKQAGGSSRLDAIRSSPGTVALPSSATAPDYVFCESGGYRLIGMLYVHYPHPTTPYVTYLVGASHQVVYYYNSGILSNHYGTCWFAS